MGNAAPDHPVSPLWTTAFVTRLHRYRSLLLRRWWILLLTVCIGLFVQAWLVYQRAPSFLSQSKMMLAGKLNISHTAEDELLDFQKQNNIGFIQEEGNSAAAYLVKLNQNFAALKTEYDLLSMLDLDQNLDRKQAKPDSTGSTNPQPSDDSAGMAFT